MKKAFFLMLLFVVILFGVIFGLKWIENKKTLAVRKKAQNIIATVSSVEAKKETWTPKIKVVGSTRTVKGVNVTTELAGMIREISFTPGAHVQQGDLLVKLDIVPDIAKLHDLQAQAWIAGITYRRDKKQYAVGGVSKEVVDTDKATLESNVALVEEQKGTIAKKIIRAPFSGRLGISLIYPGQFLNPGDAIVNLQTLQPIYVDFYIPQHEIPDLKLGQTAEIALDQKNQKVFNGEITTINPLVDDNVRNIEVEVTLPNKEESLLPGMFVYVTLTTGAPVSYVTLPQQAITFNPYGAIVYTLHKTSEMHDNQPVWQAQQEFVKPGEVRGNQVAVTQGVNAGDVIVSSGQLKIHNGSLVVINNKVQPLDNPNPKVSYDE